MTHKIATPFSLSTEIEIQKLEINEHYRKAEQNNGISKLFFYMYCDRALKERLAILTKLSTIDLSPQVPALLGALLATMSSEENNFTKNLYIHNNMLNNTLKYLTGAMNREQFKKTLPAIRYSDIEKEKTKIVKNTSYFLAVTSFPFGIASFFTSKVILTGVSLSLLGVAILTGGIGLAVILSAVGAILTVASIYTMFLARRLDQSNVYEKMFNIYEQAAPYSIDNNGFLSLQEPTGSSVVSPVSSNNMSADLLADSDVDSKAEHPSSLRRNSFLQSPTLARSETMDYLSLISIAAR